MLSAWPVLTPSAATEHDNEPLLQSTAASSTAGIPEAATEHSEIQRLLAFANASTPASKVACQEESDRIAKRIQILLSRGYKCYSQVCCQAESTIVSNKWLTKSELNKIKAECKDECCNPRRWINAPSEAPTEHSEIRRLLNLADENPNNSEAATGHSKIPEAACLESRRSKKSEKGTCLHSRKTSSDSPTSSDTETPIPTMIPSDYTQVPSPASSNQCPSSTTTDIETLIPTEIESDDEQVPTVIASDDEPEIENIEPESKRPKIASENSQSSEAATEHFKIPEAACLETKRPRKSGKGSFSQTQKMMFPATNANPGA